MRMLPRSVYTAFYTHQSHHFPGAGVRSIMAQSKQELLSTPGVAQEQDPTTKDFIFQQTMYSSCPLLFTSSCKTSINMCQQGMPWMPHADDLLLKCV